MWPHIYKKNLEDLLSLWYTRTHLHVRVSQELSTVHVLHADVSAALLPDGTRLHHLALCLENASELIHAVLDVRCHVA